MTRIYSPDGPSRQAIDSSRAEHNNTGHERIQQTLVNWRPSDAPAETPKPRKAERSMGPAGHTDFHRKPDSGGDVDVDGDRDRSGAVPDPDSTR